MVIGRQKRLSGVQPQVPQCRVAQGIVELADMRQAAKGGKELPERGQVGGGQLLIVGGRFPGRRGLKRAGRFSRRAALGGGRALPYLRARGVSGGCPCRRSGGGRCQGDRGCRRLSGVGGLRRRGGDCESGSCRLVSA